MKRSILYRVAVPSLAVALMVASVPVEGFVAKLTLGIHVGNRVG